MNALSDADLYRRGIRTLLASWEACARGSRGATVVRERGVAAAVFPAGPERAFYNNAVLQRDLPGPDRAAAVDAMESAYAAAGITQFAAWAHEADAGLGRYLSERGYTITESTQAMALDLAADLRLPRPPLDLAPSDWREYLRIIEVPPGMLDGADPADFHVLIARLDGESVAAGMSIDRDGDCGIFNVGTREHARRRGLATALTACFVHDAAARGCRTASLQATPMAERAYAAVGFRDLGRITEYSPPPS